MLPISSGAVQETNSMGRTLQDTCWCRQHPIEKLWFWMVITFSGNKLKKSQAQEQGHQEWVSIKSTETSAFLSAQAMSLDLMTFKAFFS